MLIFLVERRRLADLVKFAVDADAREAVLLPLREFLLILALTAAHDGGEEVGAGALGQRHHAIDHLADRLRRNRLAGGGRIRRSEEHTSELQSLMRNPYAGF